MNFWHSFKSALISIRTKKVRSFLTMLGIVIGVTQIIVLIGLGNGIKKDVNDEITQLGSNILFVIPGKIKSDQGYNPAASIGASTITEADIAAIRQMPDIKGVTPLGLMAAQPTAGGNVAAGAMVMASESSFLDLLTMYKLTHGRFFTDAEDRAAAPVIVLGENTVASLFPGVSLDKAIGQTVRLGKSEFKVIGTIEMSQSSFTFSEAGGANGGLAIVPYQTAKKLNPNTQIFRVGVKIVETVDTKVVKKELEAKLLDLHGADDTTVFTQDDILEVVDSILGLITQAIVALASISLIVGGIGIMNIMLVAVTERTREIGLRKAVGATRMSILMQFLIESAVLSLIGGAIGVAIAEIASLIVKNQFNLTIVVDLNSILIATLFSLGIGVIFGLAPAIRAARKDPIEALRYE